MVSMRKVIGVLSSAFLLCLGQSNVANANSAAAEEDMNAIQSEREGGQAGLKADDEKLTGEPVPSQRGRKGGQAGLKGDEDKLKSDHRTMPGRESGQAGLKSDQDKLSGHKGSHTIMGEVLSIEGDIYYLHKKDGKTERVHTDQTTKRIGNIQEGTLIEAEVNAQGHALSIRSAGSTDPRNEADQKG